MTESPLDKLRSLAPQLTDDELGAAHERLRRYVSLAVAVAQTEDTKEKSNLTHGATGVNVNPGQVDPSTFTKNG